jgi:hypothetical protein
LTSGVAAVFEGPLNLDAFVRGTDGAVWFTTGTERPPSGS